MIAYGRSLTKLLRHGSIVFLYGDLGAGKTTIVKGILAGLGHTGNATSPTFTLVEPYTLDAFDIYHFDLYRMESPDELEAIGIRDMLDGHSICLFEWPEKSDGLLPAPDLAVEISFDGNSRQVFLRGPLAGCDLPK